MEEKKAMEQSVIVSRMMADMMQYHERENKRLWVAVIALAVAFVIMSGCMIWTVQNAQRIANEAMANALEAVAEMEVVTEETTVTTQTVEGDSAVINNAEWEQYNDYASKIAGGE